MALKKRDFQKIAQHIQEFLNKLICDEDTADLRDVLNLALLYMQRYYKSLRTRKHSNGISPRNSDHRSLSGTLLFTNSCGAISPVSPACGVPNQFEWKWVNLESPKLSASLGTNEFSSLSPLLHAAKAGEKEVLKELLNNDADAITSVDGLGRNGVMYAVHGNTEYHTECLELLMSQTQCSLDHQANDESTALHVAAHENNSPALTLLLQNKASCNIADNEGRTPLHWAAANSSIENVKLLLQHGASIGANDCEGLTPAMWACHFDQLSNLILLKSALTRIDPHEDAIYEETDLRGRTVVHWAVNKTGSIECLKELLTASSGLLCDSEKKNILHTAAEQGVLSACQLVLDVCGNKFLSMTDNKGRTPLHLAALCAHADIINFLLEQGANLSTPDNSGQTPVDLIKRKHLYYCMMVLDLNPQYQSVCSNDQHQDLHSSHPWEDDTKESSHQKVLSTLPEYEIYRDTNTPKHDTKKDSPRSDEKSLNRRKSEPPSRPKPAPRQNRKKSAPASPRSKDNTSVVQEKNTNKDQITDNQSYDSSVIIENEERDKEIPVRRQSLLMRQGGIQEEQAPNETVTSFDLGSELVILGDIDDLQTNVGDLDDDIEIDFGSNQDDQENFEHSGHRLAEERGSPPSVHSEPDNADNCSVSVELSVSSLGSDNEDVLHKEGNENYMQNCSQGSPRAHHQPVHLASRGMPLAPHPPQDHIHPHSHPSQHHPAQNQPILHQSQNHPLSHSSQVHSHILLQGQSPPFSHPSHSHSSPHPPHHFTQSENNPSYNSNTPSAETPLEQQKKKKKKNKNKKKLSAESDLNNYPIGPLRGVVAPLEPPDGMPSSPSKLGGIEVVPHRPGPWEHASIGLLRRGSPESPRFGPHGPMMVTDDDGRGNRPWTPESPSSPRNNKHQPSSQGSDVMYNPPGPLAHGQALLRTTDIVRAGPPAKLDARSSTNSIGLLTRSKSPQHTFSLHSPIPHPPQK